MTPKPLELAPLRFSRLPAACLTHTVLLFSAVWLCTVTGSDSAGIVPEWICAALAPSAKSRSLPVATSDKNENSWTNIQTHRRSSPVNISLNKRWARLIKSIYIQLKDETVIISCGRERERVIHQASNVSHYFSHLCTVTFWYVSMKETPRLHAAAIISDESVRSFHFLP